MSITTNNTNFSTAHLFLDDMKSAIHSKNLSASSAQNKTTEFRTLNDSPAQSIF